MTCSNRLTGLWWDLPAGFLLVKPVTLETPIESDGESDRQEDTAHRAHLSARGLISIRTVEDGTKVRSTTHDDIDLRRNLRFVNDRSDRDRRGWSQGRRAAR